jgi:hypothetical protein
VINNSPPIDWYAKVRLLTPAYPAYDGSLIECIKRWDRLPSELRARAFIAANTPVAGKEFLMPSDLATLIVNPEYLTA